MRFEVVIMLEWTHKNFLSCRHKSKLPFISALRKRRQIVKQVGKCDNVLLAVSGGREWRRSEDILHSNRPDREAMVEEKK